MWLKRIFISARGPKLAGKLAGCRHGFALQRGLWHPMVTRVPAWQRTREELTALTEGRLSTGSAKDELVKLATRLIGVETTVTA
jgi:hypothetical protein